MANKKRKCKHCKEYVVVADTGVILPGGFFCTMDHAVEFAKEKGAKQRAKTERKELKERKEKLKTAGDYIKEAQIAVNKYIRLRDHNKPCISCGTVSVTVFGGYKGACGWDAGHYRSRGSAPHLRFNLLNIHKQCVQCNRYGSGNVNDYRIGLINRIGAERVEQLEQDNSYKKFTIDYLKRVKTIFNKRARFYQKRLGD